MQWWSPTYLPNTSIVFGRRQCLAFSLTWWNMIITSYGQTTVFTDIGFGGYHYNVRFKDGFWFGEGDRYTLDYCIEDFFVSDPGGTPIVAYPPFNVTLSYHPVLFLPFLRLDNQSGIPDNLKYEIIAPLPELGAGWRGEYPQYNTLPRKFKFDTYP